VNRAAFGFDLAGVKPFLVMAAYSSFFVLEIPGDESVEVVRNWSVAANDEFPLVGNYHRPEEPFGRTSSDPCRHSCRGCDAGGRNCLRVDLDRHSGRIKILTFKTVRPIGVSEPVRNDPRGTDRMIIAFMRVAVHSQRGLALFDDLHHVERIESGPERAASVLGERIHDGSVVGDHDTRAREVPCHPGTKVCREPVVQGNGVCRFECRTVGITDQAEVVHLGAGGFHSSPVAAIEIRPHRPAEEIDAVNRCRLVEQKPDMGMNAFEPRLEFRSSSLIGLRV
jgi:hypothetical protein